MEPQSCGVPAPAAGQDCGAFDDQADPIAPAPAAPVGPLGLMPLPEPVVPAFLIMAGFAGGSVSAVRGGS